MLVAELKRPEEVVRAVADVLLPPKRITPSEAANGVLRNDRDVLDIGVAPYLTEPLDTIADRLYQGTVLVAPARTGKTFGFALAGMFYAITVAPADILAVYMSQDTARDFSRRELDRAISNTPQLAALLSPRARDDNTYDKYFRNGVALKIGWPAATQLRGQTVRYVWLMDYDGVNADSVDGRGSMWSQASKRIETYMSRGHCAAESSPGFSYDDPDWQPSTPHEAPPARGIAALYNSGTRARWYWRCLHCREHFEAKPGLEIFLVPEFEEVREAVQHHDLMMLAESWAKVPCPHCGAEHGPGDKQKLNRVCDEGGRIGGATWLHEGQSIENGRITGERRRTTIASYWLGGAAAAYQPWVGLVHKYLAAVQTYVRTGAETDICSSTQDDQAWPYLPLAIRLKRTADDYKGRSEELEARVVPPGVRFLTAAVDVQKRRFVVQVQGWGVALESWLIDRFHVVMSEREIGGNMQPLDPAAFVEDWMLLRRLVIERSYPVAGTDLELVPELVLCDSGGEEGVTTQAYSFWRQMRDQSLGKRFMLVKGDGNPNAPRAQLTWPDARARKDRSAGRGDVPVWRLNSNVLKDAVNGDLNRPQPGPGYVHIPTWVDADYYAELTAEVRTAKGWERRAQTSNEAFDLHYYNRAACLILGAEAIDWDDPPAWAAIPSKQKPPEPESQERSGKRGWLSTRRGSYWQ